MNARPHFGKGLLALTCLLVLLLLALLILPLFNAPTHVAAIPAPTISAKPSQTPSPQPMCKPNYLPPNFYTLEPNKPAGKFALGPPLSNSGQTSDASLFNELKRRLCGDLALRRGPDPILFAVVDMIVNRRDPNTPITDVMRRQRLESLLKGVVSTKIVKGADVTGRYSPYVVQKQHNGGVVLEVKIKYSEPAPNEPFLRVEYRDEQGSRVQVDHRDLCGGQPYADLKDFPETVWPARS